MTSNVFRENRIFYTVVNSKYLRSNASISEDLCICFCVHQNFYSDCPFKDHRLINIVYFVHQLMLDLRILGLFSIVPSVRGVDRLLFPFVRNEVECRPDYFEFLVVLARLSSLYSKDRESNQNLK